MHVKNITGVGVDATVHDGLPLIAFSWNGLPQYAARQIKAAIDALGQPCSVIGSKPTVPVRGMEAALNQKVHWVDANATVTWAKLGLDIPHIFIQSGWSYPAFAALGREVKANGGIVIGLSDANWRRDFRQLVLGPIMFRWRYRRNFDAMLVPGQQGLRLMKYFGMPARSIRTGMYGADSSLFKPGPPLQHRPKSFLYVGQFISRKDVLGLCAAFQRFSTSHPDWTLRIVGNGEQRSLIPAHSKIVVEDFVQPEALKELYWQSRFFVLPSRVEAWGLVVHEATLCGCALVLSDAIGSGDDLATAENAIRFTAGSEASLFQALVTAARMDSRQLEKAEKVSLTLSSQFGPDRFSSEVKALVTGYLEGQGPIHQGEQQ
jgi:glycosyltransferase involved in cell wall biosynthesis